MFTFIGIILLIIFVIAVHIFADDDILIKIAAVWGILGVIGVILGAIANSPIVLIGVFCLIVAGGLAYVIEKHDCFMDLIEDYMKKAERAEQAKEGK